MVTFDIEELNSKRLTVAELIEALRAFPQDAVVFLPVDDNYYSEFASKVTMARERDGGRYHDLDLETTVVITGGAGSYGR